MCVRPELAEARLRRLGSRMTWAEDKATVGTDLSADPGARPKDGRLSGKFAARLSSGLRDGIKAVNPSRRSREPAPTKVARITGKSWPDYPERAPRVFGYSRFSPNSRVV